MQEKINGANDLSVGRLQQSHLTLFPQENRERQGSLAQLEVMALRIRQNVGCRSVAETVDSFSFSRPHFFCNSVRFFLLEGIKTRIRSTEPRIQ